MQKKIKYIFHIADLHFRTYKRLDESREACEKFLSEVSDYISENKLDFDEVRIVIAGE